MTVDRLPGDGVEPDPEPGQGVVEGVVIRGRQGWAGVDARRERIPRTVQAPLLSVVPAGHPGSAPGVVVRHTAVGPVCRC